MKKISVLIVAMMMFVGSIFAEDIVVFEPGVTPAKGGQVVEVAGETYFKIKCFGYDTSFKIPEVDLNGCTEFEASGYVEKENLKYQVVFSIKDASWGDISNPTIKGLKVEKQTVTAEHEIQQSWNKLSKTDIAAMIQPMVQDAKEPFNPHNYTIYIGKIVARKK